MLLLAIFFTLFGGIITLLGQAYLIYNIFWKNDTEEEAMEEVDQTKVDPPKFVFCKLPTVSLQNFSAIKNYLKVNLNITYGFRIY